jgi:Rieske Fe-S protein
MEFFQRSISRQKFILSASLALAATAIAACTTYGKKPVANSSPTAKPSGSAPGGQANAIAKTSDVSVGSGLVVGDIVVTQPSAGVFKGFSATCTHQGCTVAEVENGTINCPCHGSRFNLDGSVANGPASRPLPAEAVSVQGDSIVRG